MTKTISQAKNAVARALRALLDPPLSNIQKNAIWEFFKAECCYCGKVLNKDNREGHMDHLDSASTLGANNLGNLVLACCNCNGDEKLDKNWIQFLSAKCEGDESTFETRKRRIENWAEQNVGAARPLSEQQRAEIEAAINRVHAVLTSEAERLRQLRNR
jgi:hypothetical protein